MCITSTDRATWLSLTLLEWLHFILPKTPDPIRSRTEAGAPCGAPASAGWARTALRRSRQCPSSSSTADRRIQRSRIEHGSRSAVLSTCLSGAHRPVGSDALHATAPTPPHGQGTHSFGVEPKQLVGARLTTLTRPPHDPTVGPTSIPEWGQLKLPQTGRQIYSGRHHGRSGANSA